MTTERVARSVRLGRRERVRAEMTPPLRAALIHWADDHEGDLDAEQINRLALSLDLTPKGRYASLNDLFTRAAKVDDDRLLDVVEEFLIVPEWSQEIRVLFNLAGSTLTVSPDGGHMVEVVDSTMEEVARAAMLEGDAVTEDLAEAWAKAFGRDPDAADAWGHAITALEGLLIPLVVPAQTKANLGHVIGALSGEQGKKWQTVFPQADEVHAVGGIAEILRQVWPNPGRHGDLRAQRTPTLDEARAVVPLAAAVVHIARQGALVKPRVSQ